MLMRPSRRGRRIAGAATLAIGALYGLLLIPERAPPQPRGAGAQPFVWNRQDLWSSLEERFRAARAAGGAAAAASTREAIDELRRLLDGVASGVVPPDDPRLDALEAGVFQAAPLVASAPEHLPEFLAACTRLRRLVKRHSESWPADAPQPRRRLYRLLYGSRAALEEVMLQAPPEALPAVAGGDDEPSAGPCAEVRGVKLCSGDILVSRGGAATSALIARGNDFPGNFSHVGLVHVSGEGEVSVVEAHIESGVGVTPFEDYLRDTKLRIMVLRLRADLPACAADALLPHRAATAAWREVSERHIPYDFAMDHSDPAMQFCSEVASAAYRPLGVTLWMERSRLSSPGLTGWLAALGVRHFETQEPSDLEYDPQLRVVAEWRDARALFEDHAASAAVDAMLGGAEAGDRLGYSRLMLPPARLAKAWSVLLNLFGGVGPVPEGMSATTALRVRELMGRHAAILELVLERADAFRTQQGYAPPYWELVELAREAHRELAERR